MVGINNHRASGKLLETVIEGGSIYDNVESGTRYRMSLTVNGVRAWSGSARGWVPVDNGV
jgi:hypothetical protein